MTGVLVDTCVILDVVEDDPNWCHWSLNTLETYCSTHLAFIDAVIYAELSVGYETIEEVETAVGAFGFQLAQIPKEALFLAGKAYLQYKRNQGSKSSPLPDFFIGAHAAVAELPLITRDTARVRTYFPTVALISPESETAHSMGSIG